MGSPNVYPTGVTRYNPQKCYNGYTLFNVAEVGTVLIDMNGGEIRIWDQLRGFPNKLMKGGYVFGHSGERDEKYGYQDNIDLLQIDWNGNVIWKFDRHELVHDNPDAPQWMARQHHDFQRKGNPVGYYVPGMEAKTDNGNTLLLCHRTSNKPKISPYNLCDDVFIEVDWEGNIVWEWVASDHFNEIGFTEEQKNTIFRNPNMHKAGGGMGDLLHINCMSELGPNKWFDQGDKRFKPNNIIFDSREANFLAIIDRETGKIVWKIGPDFINDENAKEIGNIIGPHMTHMVPQGLPGAGNILVFDNGGAAGYGAPDENSRQGQKTIIRDYSRVLEINPMTKQIVWQYGPKEANKIPYVNSNHFYSPLTSGAQRLPNGNTLITIGMDGRIIEVTKSGEIVWEYVSPYVSQFSFAGLRDLYRAYRYPYDYVPQAKHSEEKEIVPPDQKHYRLLNAVDNVNIQRTSVAGTHPYPKEVADIFCVSTDDDDIFDDDIFAEVF